MHNFCLVNGEIRKTTDPVLLVNDLGVLRGYGVFDFMPVKDSIPLYFEDYWNRFHHSAERMMLPFNFDQTVFEQQLQELIRLNNMTDGYCRIVLTGGYSTNGFTPDGPPNLMVTTQGPISYSEQYYSEGIKLITLDYVRNHPQIKSINYTTVMLQRERLKNEGAEDVLYVSNGTISESSRSNFFIIDPMGMLMTPATGILNGITRKNVLEIARKDMREVGS